jgi:hypothetical protein
MPPKLTKHLGGKVYSGWQSKFKLHGVFRLWRKSKSLFFLQTTSTVFYFIFKIFSRGSQNRFSMKWWWLFLWSVAFFQKWSYNWRVRECIGLVLTRKKKRNKWWKKISKLSNFQVFSRSILKKKFTRLCHRKALLPSNGNETKCVFFY